MDFDLTWSASWQQDGKYYCTLIINTPKFDQGGFENILGSTLDNNYGAWRYDKEKHGVEIWFWKKQNMLTFRMLTAGFKKQQTKVHMVHGISTVDVRITFDPQWGPELMSEDCKLILGIF